MFDVHVRDGIFLVLGDFERYSRKVDYFTNQPAYTLLSAGIRTGQGGEGGKLREEIYHDENRLSVVREGFILSMVLVISASKRLEA